jgi:hypothetical protein
MKLTAKIPRRIATHVRTNHRVGRQAIRRVMQELARKAVAIRSTGSYARSGQLGGISRRQSMTPEQRSAAARIAAKARWKKQRLLKEWGAKSAASKRARKAAAE